MTSAPSTIVCAVDGSPESDELVRIGAGLAKILEAGLERVHILAAQPAATSVEAVEAHGMLDGICDAAGATFATRRLVRYGDPARRIAAAGA